MIANNTTAIAIGTHGMSLPESLLFVVVTGSGCRRVRAAAPWGRLPGFRPATL
jgi:hypothetical protein